MIREIIQNHLPGKKNRQNLFIIAEIGTGHGGDKQKAFDLISAARETGCDCAKFQMVYADEIIHPLTGYVDLPGGKTALYDIFSKLEQSLEFYLQLKEYTEKAGLTFLCTPFGLKSAGILGQMDMSAIKIASPEINHIPLLQKTASLGVPVILSSGVSTMGDIEEAIRILGTNTILLHCITHYPAPEEEYNLRLLPLLSQVFGLPVGVSDHSTNPVLVPVLTTAMGGVVIEKHFTLSNNHSGLDDPISLDPVAFSLMVRSIREAANRDREQNIALMKKEFGRKKVEKVLGTGIKSLAPSEMENYRTTNRSIHAFTRLKPGEKLSEKNIAILRSEKNLKPGLHPRYFSTILGKRVCREVENGQGILWDDLLTD